MHKTRYCAMAFAMLAPNVQAAIEGFEFTSVQGEPRITLSADPVNPASTFDVVVSGGLDRKIKVEILSEGVVLSSQVSGVITINDRQTFNGKEFYGKRLTLQTPTEGQYTLKATLLSLDDTLVTSWQQALGIDITPPDVSNACFSWDAYHDENGCAGDTTNWVVGPSEFMGFYLRQFEPDNIASVTFKSYLASDLSSPQKTYDAAFEQGEARIPNVLFPLRESEYVVRAYVTDTAGNTSMTEQPLKYDGSNGVMPEPVGVYNPDYAGNFLPGSPFEHYEPYTASGYYYTNPVKLVYRVPRDNYYMDNPDFGLRVRGYGATGGAAPAAYLDDEYAYFEAWGTDQPGWDVLVGVYQLTAWSSGWLRYDLIPAAGVPQAPVITAVKFYWSDGEVGGRNLNAGDIGTILERVRIEVEPRSYNIVWDSHQGLGICSIPAGQTFCETTPDWSPAYTGYERHDFGWIRVRAEDRSLYSRNMGPAVWVDVVSPEIVSAQYDEQSRVLTWMSEENDDYWPRRINSVSMKGAVEVYDGHGSLVQRFEHLPATWPSAVTHRYEATVPLLPDDTYTFRVFSADGYDNTDSYDMPAITIDGTAPVVTLTNGGLTDFTQMSGLDNFRIGVVDFSSYSIAEVRLTGGPTQEDVILATRLVSDNLFAIEYPRIFPSLETGQEYTLSATVVDAFGNQTSKTASFTYLPPNLVDVGNLDALAVNQSIAGTSDEPVAVIQTDTLRVENGALALGPQTLQITLRSDSELAVVINAQVVQPGQTIETTIDLTETEGRVYLPVYPAESGAVGTAHFMVSIPQLSNSMIVQNEAGQRLYGDGSAAESCDRYLNPEPGRFYIGDTGSGIYLLSSGEAVECDMGG